MKKVNLTFLGTVLIICTVIISQFTPGLGSISSALAKSDLKVASTIIRTRAVLASAGKEYFVSPGGSSSGTCLVETPCTYTRAEQLANAGDTITFLQGTYGPVIVGKDGLTLQGKNAVIDTTAQNGIRVARNNVTVRDFIVQRTWSHAVLVTGKNVTVENITVRESIRENANITNDLISSCKSTSWGSGIKAQLGAENVVFRGNTVHNNCGEGIAVTRGIGALVENNIVYDNFSVNIYVDNSNGVVVRNNETSCYDPHFYRNNKPAQSVLLGIENYSGWGNQMHDILIANNYVEACGGIRLYAESGYTLGQNVVIRDNIFWNVTTPFVHVPGATENATTAITIFSDVSISHWAWNSIERLYKAGITSGCGNGKFCPDDVVTRDQMAVFLLKAKEATPSAATGTMFSDIPASHWAAAWIEELANEGITSGCGDGKFCPDGVVTRGQMAIFLLKAKGMTPPTATGTIFSDVPASHWAAAWIEELANKGITTGCGNGKFCPDSPVTRAQMAVFLVKMFNLPQE